MTTFSINQTISNHPQHGNGVVTAVNGSRVTVNFNGTQKVMMASLLKENYKAKKVKTRKVVQENPIASLASSLMNVSEGNKTLGGLSVWAQIMEVADEKGHFASDVIEKALAGKTITQKQAYAVAYFANENNIK